MFMENRVFNFSAGPGTLPLPVLQEAQQHLLAMPGAGMSIMECSHRSPLFMGVMDEAAENIRKLLQLPDNYRVLFLQGGARMQFYMVPFNLIGFDNRQADYFVTGSWGKKAVAEAKALGQANVVWNGAESGFRSVPAAGDYQINPQAVYAHFTSNETIEGVQFRQEPDTGNVPLVCDASSDIFSRPIDIAKYGLIYAGAQKNAGCAGVTLVIIRDDMLAQCRKDMTQMLHYPAHYDQGSMLNTPPVFAVYIVSLVTRWLLNEMGGLEEMARINAEKAELLYDAIDNSGGFYKGCADPAHRSHMNVTFRLGSKELEDAFIQQAKSEGLTDLKGHRSVGGIRASIYNAMTIEGVDALRNFMYDFRDKYLA